MFVLTRSAVVIALGWNIGQSVPSEAHVGDRVYPISELTDEMLAQIDLKDGSWDEWRELLGEPAMTILDFRKIFKEQEFDLADLDLSLWLAWHGALNRFYVAAVLSDDQAGSVETVQDPSSFKRHDSITLIVDGDHSGGEHAVPCFQSCTDEEILLLDDDTQTYDAIGRHSSGQNVDLPSTREHAGVRSWTTFPPYSDGGGGSFGEAPTIHLIEFYVTPFDRMVFNSVEESVVTDLVGGKIIGYTIMVFDQGDPDQIQDLWVHNDAPDDLLLLMRGSDHFVDGVLLPASGGLEGDSAVEEKSWGRIKASFADLCCTADFVWLR